MPGNYKMIYSASGDHDDTGPQRVTMSFLVEYVRMAPEGTRLFLAYNILRIMLDERDPRTANEHYNMLATVTYLLAAEFEAQFPKEAAELEFFWAAKPKRREFVGIPNS
jgi:hypothetical protein